MHEEHVVPRQHDAPPTAFAAMECACVTPVPVQRAERKGVARTHCARCGRPTPLRFTPPPRAWL